MKARLTIMIAVLLTAAAPPAQSVDRLAWMAGRWESTEGDRWIEEYWSAPRGGGMIGHSRSGRGDMMREYEFLRIAPLEDGTVAYLASPGGRPPVAFRLVESGPAEAVFANPQHDFPQRIRYRRDGDRLAATISADDGGNAMTWTYRLAD